MSEDKSYTTEDLLLFIDKLRRENQQLKEEVKGIREERDYLFNKTSVENKYLQQENKQLKLDYELYKDNCVYRNYEVEKKDITIKQLKEVIEEVREYVNNHIHQETFTGYMDSYELKKLLQILDKVKENK